MKKSFKIILKTLVVIIVLFFISLLIIPVFFKGALEQKLKTELNNNLNAKVDFKSFKLNLLTSFPDLGLRVDDFLIVGVDEFDLDTLISIGRLKVGVNLLSVLRKDGIEIKSVIITEPHIQLLSPQEGRPNWDILKEGETTEEDTGQEGNELSVQLRKFKIINAKISYHSIPDEMYVSLQQLNMLSAGKTSPGKVEFQISSDVETLMFKIGEIPYLNNVKFQWKGAMVLDLDHSVYSFIDQSFSLNDLNLNLNGSIDLSENDPEFDFSFHSANNSFKSFLSLIPAFYLNDFKDLKSAGIFSLEGNIRGPYVESDTIYPDAQIELIVKDASFAYGDLPAKMEKVNILLRIDEKGYDLDKTIIDVDNFSFELAGNPLKSEWHIRTPYSNPQVKGLLKARLQLSDFMDLVPMKDVKIRGELDVNMNFDVRMSEIESKNYQKIKADGNLKLDDFFYEAGELEMSVRIGEASLLFSPERITIPVCNLKIGKSDLSFVGILDNYLQYYLRDDVLQGSFSLKSDYLDVDELMHVYVDTVAPVMPDTGSVMLVKVPERLDLEFITTVKSLSYGNLKPENIKGTLIVKNEQLTLNDFHMQLFKGFLYAEASYDTSDSLFPLVSMQLRINELDIPDAFNSFKSLMALAPFAKDLRGKFSSDFSYSSRLGKDMYPIVSDMNGSGSFSTTGVQVLDVRVFDLMKGLLKLDPSYTSEIKDFSASFEVKNGNVVVQPFYLTAGSIKMNISGEHGLDQKLNYLIKTEIPRKDLGTAANGVIDGLMVQADKLGLDFDPGEIIPVNFRLQGKIQKPELSIDSFGKGGGKNFTQSVKKQIEEQVILGKEKLVEEAKNKASDEADKILKDAEEEVDKVKKLAAESADIIRQEANKSADTIVKEAEDKGPLARGLAKVAAVKVREQGDRQAKKLVMEADEKSEMLLDTARKKVDELNQKEK